MKRFATSCWLAVLKLQRIDDFPTKHYILSWPSIDVEAGPVYHESVVNSLDISEDASLLVSASGFTDGAGSTGYAQLWQLPTLEPRGGRMVHASQVSDVQFCADQETIAVLSSSPEGSDVRLWSKAKSLPLSKHLTIRNPGEQLFIDRWLGLVREEHSMTARIAEASYPGKTEYSATVASIDQTVPSWFYHHFLPFLSGKKVDQNGKMEPLTPAQLHDSYVSTRAGLEQEPVGSPYRSIASWALEDRSHRLLTPYTNKTVAQAIEEQILDSIQSEYRYTHGAYIIDPAHPLAMLLMAVSTHNDDATGEEVDAPENRFLRRLTVERLLSPNCVESYGVDATIRYLRLAIKLFQKKPDSDPLIRNMGQRLKGLQE